MPRFADEVIDVHGVTLRELRAADIPEIARACQDATTQRWLPLPRPYTEESARAFALELAPQSLERGSGIERAIEVDGDLVGVIGLKSTDWAALKTEAGYWLAPWGRGAGVMTRALCALTDWALDTQGMVRVEVRIAPDNVASLAVARRALFIREGLLRRAGVLNTGPTDLVILSRLRDDARPLLPTNSSQPGLSNAESLASAVIVQDDVFDSTESVTIVPITTMLTDAPLLRMRRLLWGCPGWRCPRGSCFGQHQPRTRDSARALRLGQPAG